LCKPFNIQDLFKTVANCLERQQLNLSHLRQSELKSFFVLTRPITSR
jgi:DNA-binding NtrC family response regulator